MCAKDGLGGGRLVPIHSSFPIPLVSPNKRMGTGYKATRPLWRPREGEPPG